MAKTTKPTPSIDEEKINSGVEVTETTKTTEKLIIKIHLKMKKKKIQNQK